MTEEPDPADVTRLLACVRAGEHGAEQALVDAVYGELRRLATARMRRERAMHTLQATALVHEAWLRLDVASDRFADRRHFFGAAARVMRQILVDRYRRAHSHKRGGAASGADPAVGAIEVEAPSGLDGLDLIALNDAMDELERHDARMAQIVQLRFFAGLSVEETAETLEVSPRTVKREWAVAKAWLFQRIGGDAT